MDKEIEYINQKLIDNFGLDTSTGRPIWRVVFSDDQFEKRLMDVTDEGLQLLYPVVREVPKYRQWIQHKWVLERLVVVPEVNQKELPDLKLSYEPLFVFEDGKGNPLPAKWEVAKFVVDTVYAATGKESLAKYKEDPDAAKKRVKQIEEELFGDVQSDVIDSLHTKQGVVVPEMKES